MQIIHHLSIDLARQLPMTPIGAVQGDANTRAVEIALLENGGAWEVPEGVTAAVAFRKPDKTRGLYDTLPDKTKAVTITGSTVTAILAPQVLSCAGEVSAAVVFYDSKLNQLATFPFALRVANNPAAGQQVSNDYYQYSTMEEVSAAVEAALAALEDSKQDFLAKAEDALSVVHDTATEDAPAIVCEATGAVITAEDAANRPLSGLSIYGKTTQDGTPTPENPIALVSAGDSGAITVSIANGTEEPGQTLTASTPNGLPGIPISSGGNYTDENGQQWICDEIDFARGVYVQRISTLNMGTLQYNYKTEGRRFLAGISSMKNDGKIGYPVLATCYRSQENLGYSVSNDYAISTYMLYGQSVVIGDPRTTDGSELKELLAGETLMYVRKTPIETPLSAGELAAYAALHSNKPNTTVFNDSGAGMKISYVADTKTYIDNKLAAISAAILS